MKIYFFNTITYIDHPARDLAPGALLFTSPRRTSCFFWSHKRAKLAMTSLPRRPSSQRVQSIGHAWLFFISFVLFPLWPVAACCVPVPRRGRLGDDAEGKGTDSAQVLLDDAQLEFGLSSFLARRGLYIITLNRVYDCDRCQVVAETLSNHGRSHVDYLPSRRRCRHTLFAPNLPGGGQRTIRHCYVN
jgi:hypothetical protein